jgi:hypothetical protein
MTGLGPQFSVLDEIHSPETKWTRRRIIIFALAAFVTISGLVTALVLGKYGYDIRRSNMHKARLKGILVQSPTEYQVTEGLKEKAPLVYVVKSPQDLDAAIEKWGASKEAEIREKAAQWPDVRVYDAGDMMYFIFYDRKHVMRDYVYVSN